MKNIVVGIYPALSMDKPTCDAGDSLLFSATEDVKKVPGRRLTKLTLPACADRFTN